MIGGLCFDWYSVEAFIDLVPYRACGKTVVLVTVGDLRYRFIAVTDDFGNLVEVPR